MQSKLDVKVQGVRGGSPAYSENKGYVVAFIDNGTDFISVDAFQGSGENYERRKESLIKIKIGEIEWKGTADELAQVFRDVKQIADFISVDIESENIHDENDIFAFDDYKEFAEKYKA